MDQPTDMFSMYNGAGSGPAYQPQNNKWRLLWINPFAM